ncbi:HlyD family efflux transporter periplasmic adaptor subunit [Desulfogranum marinum]|uniref:HlyD family secretion protein n=1 Tax=Desulfogranum marinum TaxID=453220 RepID=UPI0029C66EF6|nr:HlyD family efflux transporter periplasmic adaptor subunit [Desulfogranum marinum]
MKYSLILSLTMLCLLGCRNEPEQALGTLEWDRVNSRIPASEAILEIAVQEGQRVNAGTLLVQIDDRKIASSYNDLQARQEQAIWQLKELKAGPREEIIAEARARLNAALATMKNSDESYQRQQALFTTNSTSKQKLDNARNTYLNAVGEVNVLSASLDKLLAGSRKEQVEQAKCRVASLQAQLEQMQLIRDEYSIRATRDGVVDSLPFKLGDRPPLNAVVCTLLAGERPWARVYIPEPYRSQMLPGSTFRLKIDGRQQVFSTRLRFISSVASFTPYFALSERDRSRLSYIAELEIMDPEAGKLTAGTPVQLLLE